MLVPGVTPRRVTVRLMTETDEHGRPDVPLAGDEVETLLGFLDYQRATLAWKCRNLTDEQLRQTLHPTAMSLGGLLMHLARVEDHWFSAVVAEQEQRAPWASMRWAAEWRDAGDRGGDELRELWAERVRASRGVAGRRDGAAQCRRTGPRRHPPRVARPGPRCAGCSCT